MPEPPRLVVEFLAWRARPWWQRAWLHLTRRGFWHVTWPGEVPAHNDGRGVPDLAIILAGRIMDTWIQEGLISDDGEADGSDPEWRKAKVAVMTMLGFVPARFNGDESDG